MKTLRRFVRRLTSWTRTHRDEERLRWEIEEHLAFQIEDNLRAGLLPDEARCQAMLKFGGMEAMKEDYRDQRGLPALETLVQDTRYSLRRLRNSPAFAVTVLLTLALGIGAHHVDLHLGAGGPVEIARRGKPGRIISPGDGSTLLLLACIQSGQRVFYRLVRPIQAL